MDVSVAIWTRDTPWRQGHVLSGAAVAALGLQHFGASGKSLCVVVISHDCDLANDDLQIEPDVEVIIGCLPQKPDGNYYWAKAPRTLHMDALKDSAPVVIELTATAKRLVPKKDLAAFQPDAAYSLSGQTLSALRYWLGVRYNRAAFPDELVKRLAQTKVDKAIAKLMEPVGPYVSAVYFEVDGGEQIHHSQDSPFVLKIVLLYPPGDNPEHTADKLNELSTAIEDVFTKKYFDSDNEKWNGIHLKACLPISEDDMPVSKTRLLTEWRLEHMSLRAQQQPAKK